MHWRNIVLLFVSLLPCFGADVTFDRIVHADQNPAEWLTYWGDYRANRFRNLSQINDANVGKLHLEWMYQTNSPGAFETMPLVADGVMYLTTPDYAVAAVDARSGRQLWRYQYRVPQDAKFCCGGLNRGLAILDHSLFY